MKQILLAAARIIKDEIKQTSSTRNEYPSTATLEYLPHSLHFLLSTLLQENDAETHLVLIGQATMQNTCPNLTLAPLSLGLGVQMHWQFGSQVPTESLHSQGFTLLYAENLLYTRV